MLYQHTQEDPHIHTVCAEIITEENYKKYITIRCICF